MWKEIIRDHDRDTLMSFSCVYVKCTMRYNLVCKRDTSFISVNGIYKIKIRYVTCNMAPYIDIFVVIRNGTNTTTHKNVYAVLNKDGNTHGPSLTVKKRFCH